ncbi:hypothetical protein COCNU_11G002970 [Cocos nucifera]|uniref:Uncharacterized protein n=1 Tax=Cocos nucifera TaxID=13894 RepID=A0A8K0N9N8_COCNU|nr:hypothetical protein COCNU_11G002970 [Cocos nucifera]
MASRVAFRPEAFLCFSPCTTKRSARSPRVFMASTVGSSTKILFNSVKSKRGLVQFKSVMDKRSNMPMAIIEVELETIWLLTMVFGDVQLTSHDPDVNQLNPHFCLIAHYSSDQLPDLSPKLKTDKERRIFFLSSKFGKRQ